MTISETRLRRWHCSSGHVDLSAPPRSTRIVQLDASPQDVTLDLAATAILVIDMQNDFCHDEGWLAGIGVDVTAGAALVDVLNPMLDGLRAADVPVIWVNWGNRPDRANLPPNVIHVYDGDGSGGGIGARVSALSDAVLTAGSGGAAVLDGLKFDANDIAVAKYRMSGFWDTELDSILRALQVRHLLLCGVNVDQCVYATLIDAACAGYDCLLVTDASATTSPAYCIDATLYNVRQCFGFTCESYSILAAVQAASTSPRRNQ
ncbi:MAG: isochorismatase family cysteine hydrolase [Mycobacterium sp.]